MRTAKEKARCLKVLGKQLDQLSAMKINIFECLQSEQMRQFVTGYAEAIRPVSDGRSLSIAAAEASINGTMDFMEQVGELTEVVTDTDLSGSPVTTFADELEELFGGDDGDGEQSILRNLHHRQRCPRLMPVCCQTHRTPIRRQIPERSHPHNPGN